MKSVAINLLAAAFLVALSAGAGYSASAAPADFEQRKAEQIGRLDTRIKQLQDEKACISTATSREAIRTCRQAAKPAQKKSS
jgi:hypothetical protein